MLKKITLINFMSHKETVIEPADGLTVIAGENNCGKSAIVAAIQCVCSNATGNYMVRHGEKECRVILETDDGHVVEWKRAKGKVSYVVDGESIDRTRGKVPEKVERALRMGKVEAENEEFDVHFADQKSPVFLLDGTPGQRAAFFASSSDAAKLIEMQTLHKTKVADALRDQKDLQKRESSLIVRLEKLKPVEDIEVAVEQAAQQEQAITDLDQSLGTLESTLQSLKESTRELEESEGRNRTLKNLGSPPGLADTNKLEEIHAHLTQSQQLQKETSRQLDVLSNVPTPPLLGNAADLENLIEQLAELNLNSARWYEIATHTQLPKSPEFVDTAAGEAILANLEAAERVVSRWEKSLACLPESESLEIDESTERLAQNIVALHLAHQEVEERQNRFGVAKRQEELAHEKLHQALEASGTCPTCGQELERVRVKA